MMVVFILALAGCAGARIEGAAQSLPAGGYGVTVDLVNFAFRPNVITAEAGRPITITAVSESKARHNVTIISSDGELLVDVDVPARQTRVFEVTLRQPGTYELYCDVGLHRSLGMEGTFVAR
jgi:plastocyanin